LSKDPKRVNAGKKSKRKGNNNERNLAKQFQEWWGEGQFQRTPSSGGWSTKVAREEYRTAGDLVASDPNFLWCVELKKQEAWTMDAVIHGKCAKVAGWWKQTVDETPNTLKPLLVFSKNRTDPCVMVLYNDLDLHIAGMIAMTPAGLRTFADHNGNPVAMFPLSALFALDSSLFKVKKE